jgi:soluble lytic murein transglycosylase
MVNTMFPLSSRATITLQPSDVSLRPTIGVVFFALTTILPFPVLARAEIYQFIDANGTVSLTNVPSDPRYRRIDLESTSLRNSLSEKELEHVIARHSRRHRLHPALLRAVIKAESDFDPMAVSRAGAVGLMQLMPQTAMQWDVQDIYDPDENISGGARHLRYLLDRFHGNLPLALAAYNAGETLVDRYRALPPIDETRRYVSKVLRYYRQFLFANAGSGLKTVTARAHATQPPDLAFSSFPRP